MATDGELDALIENITVDAYGDEGYWSFLQAFENDVVFPFDATLVGVSIDVTGIDFDGDERRGLVAIVDRDEVTATISLLDIEVPVAEPTANRLVAAYRRWLGIA
jgi:hypothetical protein